MTMVPAEYPPGAATISRAEADVPGEDAANRIERAALASHELAP